jgi:hypothetical protein
VIRVFRGQCCTLISICGNLRNLRTAFPVSCSPQIPVPSRLCLTAFSLNCFSLAVSPLTAQKFGVRDLGRALSGGACHARRERKRNAPGPSHTPRQAAATKGAGKPPLSVLSVKSVVKSLAASFNHGTHGTHEKFVFRSLAAPHP